MSRRICFAIAVLLVISMMCGGIAWAVGFDTKIFRAAAIGLLVKQASPGLNKFINTLTFQSHVPVGMSTKVVPILSVGEKGYVGAAQVAGPAAGVNSIQAVWVYEDNFSQNEFRLKVFVPSKSLNPLELKRAQKVGVSAIIDVALDGRWKGQTYSRSVRVGDILKAGVVAVAVTAAADPINKAINAITKGSNASTKVVPIATIGDKAYIGGAQVSGASAATKSVNAVFQYEDIFDGGKFRIKVLVPSRSTNPLKIKRVAGVGITALIDTSIADQERINERRSAWAAYRGKYSPIDAVLVNKFKGDIAPSHDQGRHLGWYIGKGNQRKMLTGVWVDRYKALSDDDKGAFVPWWNAHHKDKPDVLAVRWQEWNRERSEHRQKLRLTPVKDQGGKDKGKSEESGSGKGKGRGKD
ncbi:MAG: hypothetical protein NTU88_15205 [Armatimonadetes bacterium]|nr:hypothetical protein [Armatimonadota bacterium]